LLLLGLWLDPLLGLLIEVFCFKIWLLLKLLTFKCLKSSFLGPIGDNGDFEVGLTMYLDWLYSIGPGDYGFD